MPYPLSYEGGGVFVRVRGSSDVSDRAIGRRFRAVPNCSARRGRLSSDMSICDGLARIESRGLEWTGSMSYLCASRLESADSCSQESRR